MKAITKKIYNKTRFGGEKYDFAVYTHPGVELHRDPNHGQWECAERITSIMKLLEDGGILARDDVEIISERRLLKKEEATIHSPTLWEENVKLESMSDDQLEKWNEENDAAKVTLFACRESFEAARIAAGGVLISLDYIFTRTGFRGLVFCVIRPPGYN